MNTRVCLLRRGREVKCAAGVGGEDDRIGGERLFAPGKLSAHKRRGIWYNFGVLTDKASGRGESPSHPNGGDSSTPYFI